MRHRPQSDNALAISIARGAATNDLVQLHGAILSALERHPVPLAVVNVFTPALRIAETAHGPECRLAVAQAVQAHIDSADPPIDPQN
ncbi:MAG: hypothetical protein ACRDU4_08870 [Mycobacterium sp.]